MKRELLWLSDVHTDLQDYSLVGRYRALRRQRPRGILVTGDLSNAIHLGEDLAEVASSFSCPIYFTLGNHDYYGGSFQGVQHLVGKVCSKHKNLFYLDRNAPVWLSKSTALVGCPGWGDGRAGSGKKSSIFVNDRAQIQDFIGREPNEYFQICRSLVAPQRQLSRK